MIQARNGTAFPLIPAEGPCRFSVERMHGRKEKSML